MPVLGSWTWGEEGGGYSTYGSEAGWKKSVERGCRQMGERGGRMSKENLGPSPLEGFKKRGNFKLNQGTSKAKAQLR